MNIHKGGNDTANRMAQDPQLQIALTLIQAIVVAVPLSLAVTRYVFSTKFWSDDKVPQTFSSSIFFGLYLAYFSLIGSFMWVAKFISNNYDLPLFLDYGFTGLLLFLILITALLLILISHKTPSGYSKFEYYLFVVVVLVSSFIFALTALSGQLGIHITI